MLAQPCSKPAHFMGPASSLPPIIPRCLISDLLLFSFHFIFVSNHRIMYAFFIVNYLVRVFLHFDRWAETRVWSGSLNSSWWGCKPSTLEPYPPSSGEQPAELVTLLECASYAQNVFLWIGVKLVCPKEYSRVEFRGFVFGFRLGKILSAHPVFVFQETHWLWEKCEGQLRLSERRVYFDTIRRSWDEFGRVLLLCVPQIKGTLMGSVLSSWSVLCFGLQFERNFITFILFLFRNHRTGEKMTTADHSSDEDQLCVLCKVRRAFFFLKNRQPLWKSHTKVMPKKRCPFWNQVHTKWKQCSVCGKGTPHLLAQVLDFCKIMLLQRLSTILAPGKSTVTIRSAGDHSAPWSQRWPLSSTGDGEGDHCRGKATNTRVSTVLFSCFADWALFFSLTLSGTDRHESEFRFRTCSDDFFAVTFQKKPAANCKRDRGNW